VNARRLLSSVLAIAFGVMAFGSASALAAAPEAPETGKASAVTATTATLEGGVLNPKALASVDPGEYEYLFRVSETACEGERGAPEPAGFAVGLPKEPVLPVGLTVLQPNAKYTFCLIEFNAGGVSPASTPGHFTTPPAAPSVDSQSSPAVKSSEATLEGRVNPNNEKTSARIQYSTIATVDGSGALTGATVLAPAELGEGYGDQPVSSGAITALSAGSTYYYQVVATNATGTTNGAVKSFTTVPTPNTDPVSAIAATTATFKGHLTLNPVDTRYSFDYKVGTECTGESATPTADAGEGPGTLASPSTSVTGLIPHTQYTVCLVTSNAFGSEQGAPVSFTTLAGAPLVSEEDSREVTDQTARVAAEIDPQGSETTYDFEYGTSVAYGQSTAESPLLASDNSAHPAFATIAGLQAGTEYHYRVVARNPQSLGGTPGPDQTFRTQPAGGALVLPDEREYEMVSPPVKDGAEILGIVASSFGGRTRGAPGGSAATQASDEGTSVTYVASSPVGEHPPGNHYATQLLSTRAPSGWTTQNITTPAPNFSGFQWDEGEEYRLFSADLSHAVLQTSSFTPQAPLAPEIHQETDRNEIYVRDNSTGVFKALLPEAELASPGAGEFVGASPDLGGVVYNNGNLYERLHGEPKLVNVLPDEELAAGARLAGGVSEDGGKHAISNDATQVAWAGAGGLFTRNLTTEKTVQVDSADGGGESGGGEFQAASSDGSRVFFTDARDLISAADEGGVLMFDVHSGTLSDVTPDPSGAQVRAVLGAADDGTAMYIIAGGVLPGTTANAEGATPTAGANNIYAIREAPLSSGSWRPTFVATLPAVDARAYFGYKVGESPGGSINTAVRVSPHGGYLAFMSQGNLTGYDNRDLNSGSPDEEVYLYDAQANRLLCASCKPTGARPIGELDTGVGIGALPMDPPATWGSANGQGENVPNHWVSALIPAWNQNRLLTGFGEIGSLYESRVLSDSGRLFFDSADALMSQDVNGKEDVYEYEPAGVGSCAGKSGCVTLISSGQGNDDSVFVDASSSGGDVFFTTSDRLVNQDQDAATDMYDAHACSAAAPCYPVAAAGPPPCASTDGCRPAQTPQPGVFAAPASATFSGAGNAAPPPTAKVKVRSKTAAQIRAEKLAKALKACRKFSRRHRQAGCQVQARRKYGNAKSSGRRTK
jgi:hypothetical protein